MPRYDLLVLMALAAAVGATTTAGALQIVADGQPRVSIVVPDQPLPVVQYAAEELQYHVRRASGAELPIVAESAMPEG
ncbi:MAG TPA: hypothetical protein VM283_02885, partial [Armatimonadota bacterium]|nr:hypothetical protein [Armatimonadota bacterium]